jgi:peptidoglycan/xylan/chitin deacetylase (PgdA/CDA1 family)
MTPRLTDVNAPGPRREYVGYGRYQPRVKWPGEAKVALSLIVNNEESSEYSKVAGDSRNEGLAEIPSSMEAKYRDLCVESIYEYGSRAGIWRLMRLFDEFRVKTTFFTAAVALERNPEVAAWLRESGHEACSHGWRWEEVWLLSREDERQHIQWAVDSITKTCGTAPVGWYCRYGPSVHTRELLVEHGGFMYDSDAYNDDLPYLTTVQGKEHLVVPYTMTYNDVRYVLAQGYGSPSDFFDYCRRGLEEYRREAIAGFPKMMSVGLHPRWAGQAARTSALREFIEYALSLGDVWITRRADIATWWLQHHEEFTREEESRPAQ